MDLSLFYPQIPHLAGPTCNWWVAGGLAPILPPGPSPGWSHVMVVGSCGRLWTRPCPARPGQPVHPAGWSSPEILPHTQRKFYLIQYITEMLPNK